MDRGGVSKERKESPHEGEKNTVEPDTRRPQEVEARFTGRTTLEPSPTGGKRKKPRGRGRELETEAGSRKACCSRAGDHEKSLGRTSKGRIEGSVTLRSAMDRFERGPATREEWFG